MDIIAGEDNNSQERTEMRMLCGLDYIHIEVKRVENLNIDKAMEQAKRDAKDGLIPAVFHRKNGKKWKVTMELDRFMEIYNSYYSDNKLEERLNKEEI